MPGPILLGVVAAVYLALAQYVILLNDPVRLGAGFWPAAGVSLALLLLSDRRQWPWILAGVALAETAGDLVHGYPPGAVLLWTTGNVVEPLVAALLIQRVSTGSGVLTPLRAFVGFVVLGVIVGPLVGASIGATGTVAFLGQPASVVWPKYVVGDALGVLVVAPVLLTWRHPSTGPRSLVEAAVLAVSAAAVTLLVFQNWDIAWDVTLPYLIVPFLVWAGLRFGVRGLALVGFMVANIANWATATGYGPFAIAGGTEHAITLLQVFLAITLTSAFVVAALASDLTDSREMIRREAEHNAELQRKRQFRDAFIGVLSHELRTPVTTIFGMSSVLRKRYASMERETIGEHLVDIEMEADRLRRLTEDLLVLSRAEGGQLVVAAHPIVIPHLVRSVVDGERTRWRAHRFQVEAPPTGLPIALGEDVHVEQVVRNLVGNAAKYSPAGTLVRVIVTGEAGGVAVRVIDEGPGLPPGPPDRLFELFYRSSDAVSTTSGAGIGLFVCRELVQAMGGRVWARPAAPPATGGAEFGFWLPEAPVTDDDG